MSRPSRKLLQQRPELVNRYVRLAVRRWMMPKTLSLARRLSRPRLQWSERARKKALVATLKTLALETSRARRLGFEANTVVLNLGLFFLIAERDIQTVKIDALTHPDAWTRGLAARVMLLTIHELDIDKVGGNKLRQALDDCAMPECLRQEVTEAMRTVRKAQTRAQRLFAYLRNSTIAHRDADALRQYRDITEIDSLEVTKVAVDFYAGTNKFIEMIPKLLAQMTTWQGMIGQMVAQKARNEASK
jgi:hypothetical protein